MIGMRYILLFFVLLTGVLSSQAQVELYIDTVNGGVGSQVIVPIRANNFTNLVSMQGSIHFDETVLSYTNVEQLSLPGLSLGSFGTTQASSGTVTFSWFDSDLSGESETDGSVLFALRFTLIGAPGDSSLVWLDDSPTLLEFVDNLFSVQPHAIDTGLVIIDGQPAVSGLSLFGDSIIANQNDTVLVPIRVKDFNNIIGVQGTIGFDPAVASYITVEQFGVPGMTISNFGETQVGIGNLTYSWNSAGTSGATLPDSAVLFAVKYHVIGPGGSSTNVSFMGGPTPMEVVDSNLVVLNPYLAGGHIQVEPDTNGIFSLLIDTVVGMQTQLVNVPIRAKAFNDIISMQGTFAFDTSVIYYSSVVNFNLPDLSLANYGTTQVSNGLLSFSWFDQDLTGETYADSTILFELVFQIHGNIGDFGEVIMNSTMTPIEIVELGNLPIPYVLDSGGVIVDSLGLFINLVDPINLEYCAGDSIGLSIQGNIGAQSGNVYTLELSDATGSFASPIVIGTLASDQDTVNISGIIPTGTPMGSGYKLRANSTLPSLYGTETIANISIEYYEDSVASIICFGDSLFLEGTWQTIAGFYNDTLSTINGCDSVVITNLSFTNAVVDTVYLDVCQGDSLFLNGAWESTAGWYTDSLQSVSGCDSLIRTNITVLNVPNIPISQTICLGDSLFLQGFWQNTAGLYIDTLTAANGCDSLISTTLSLFPSDTLDLMQNICAGDSVFLAGVWQTTSGNYSDVYTSIYGCDSIVRTDLTVIPALQTFETIELCFGDSLFVGGNWQTIDGNYVDTLVAYSGCDSLILTDLTIKSAIVNTQFSTVCSGDSLFLEGSWQTTNGIYTDSLLAVDGCDSLIVTDMTVLNLITSSDAQTICAGDSLLIQGNYWSVAGTYVDTFPSQVGCDSIVSFTLSIETHPLYNNSIQVCTGDSVFLEGDWQLISGTYIDTFPSILGCDSIIHTDLNVINSIQTLVNESICLGDSLFLEGGWQQTAGLYLDTLTAVAGCDSIISTTLAVLLPTAGFDTLTICDGDSVLIGSVYQSVAGNYPDVLIGSNGCDSIVDVLLVVNPTYFIQNAIDICQGDSILLEESYQTASGIYLDTNSTLNGCDSIIETSLTVNPTYYVQTAVDICQGDSLFLQTIYQTTSGVYLDTVLSVSGCDSIIETTLTVFPTYFAQTPLTICQGDSVLLEGSYQTTAGIYLDTVSTMNGCDSITETTLTVNPSYLILETSIICQGDSVFVGGAYQLTSGVYSDVYFTTLGCDSIIETTLTVNPTYFTQTPANICQGDSILLEGSYQTTAGLYLDTVLTVNGCDSIIETNLTVNPIYFIQTIADICQGDSIFLESAYQTSAGIFLDTTLSISGCDSIVETTLTVNPTYFVQSPIVICQGDSILLEGVYQTTAGLYTDTLFSVSGCDSIIETTLTVNPSYYTIDAASICQGDSLLLGGAYQLTSGIYLDVYSTTLGCDSTIETTLTVNPAPIFQDTVYICQGDSALVNGNYESVAGNYLETLQTASGCDSILDVLLVVNPTYSVQTSVNICQGDSVLLEGNYQTTAGIYIDTVSTVNGCDSIVETDLTVNPAAQSNDAITICNGDSVLVNGNYLSTAGSYIDTLQTPSGCDSIVTTVISVTVIDPSVTVSSPDLTANYAFAQSYQWINCGSGNNIGTGTSQTYTAITNGSYQVLITDQGCDALSDCYEINDVSIYEYSKASIHVYPNPTFGNVKVDLGETYQNVTVKVYDLQGQLIIDEFFTSSALIDLEIEGAPGSYIIEIHTEEGSPIRVSLIKE